jgi:15-cis-phytoene synthase
MNAAIARCRDSIARHSKSFALASKLLPAECRDDTVVLYAWCRRADDAIDLVPAKRQDEALATLRAELSSVYAGEAQSDVVLAAFQDVVRRRALPLEYPSALLDGMEMDARETRYESMEVLMLYCYRVAGTVGLMMCHVLGVTRPEALRHAAHLGMGMQLTNICRDVEEDFGRGRIYVPRELLARHGAENFEVGSSNALQRIREPLRMAVAELLRASERYYGSGYRGLAFLSWRAGLAVRTAALVYAAIGIRIRRARYDVLAGRAVVSRWAKYFIVLRAVVRAILVAPIAVWRRFRRAPLDRALRYPQDVLPV